MEYLVLENDWKMIPQIKQLLKWKGGLLMLSGLAILAIIATVLTATVQVIRIVQYDRYCSKKKAEEK